MNRDFIIPRASKVSGQRSRAQKTIGVFESFEINIAGIPTVIGEGS